MQFEKGTEVFTSTGDKVGTISRIVIDARTRDVTDLVVERGGLLNAEEKVIPIGLVDLAQDDRIVLGETNQSIDEFLDYETTHYVPVEHSDLMYGNVETAYWYPPVSYHMPRAGLVGDPLPEKIPQTESSIPEGRIAISEGAEVLSADDHHIGNVERIITDSDGTTVTHFVVGKGFLLKATKLVPAFWATGMNDDRIRLSVPAAQFDRLPDYNLE